MRIVVCSDDANERARVTSGLGLLGEVLVIGCSSEREAREHLQVGDLPDAIVMDGDLRPRGGYALLYELRQRAQMAGVEVPPAVILGTRPQDQWLADWATAVAMAGKPVDGIALARQLAGLTGTPLATI